MQSEKHILINNWIEKAEEALSDSEKAICNDSFSTAQNRIYYAIFYSTMALGYSRDFITSKHSQLLGWFNKTFIKENILDKKLGEIYKTAYDLRMKSDYTITFKPDKEQILLSLEDAGFFVKKIKEFISG